MGLLSLEGAQLMDFGLSSEKEQRGSGSSWSHSWSRASCSHWMHWQSTRAQATLFRMLVCWFSLWMESCQNPPLCSTAEVKKSSKFSSHKENVIWSIVVAKVPPFLSHFCSFWELGLNAIDRQNLTPNKKNFSIFKWLLRPRSVKFCLALEVLTLFLVFV